MSSSSNSVSLFGRGSRRQAEIERPIAAALPLDEAHVDLIVQSHERCASIGLSRIESPDFAPLGRPDLNETRERNRRLYTHAAPVMEMLFEQIINSQSMVVLTDPCGTIIHSIGDDDFLVRASKVALQPGVNWSESSKGTNAIGTALVSETPTLVHADEHFIHANHFLTCSACPILDPRGNMLGVLDVTGDQRRYHQHTMGLVKMSARMIENHWLSDDSNNLLRLHLHGRVEFIGTLMEGIVAVGRDGRIAGANRSALDHLGLSSAAARLHSVTSLFGTTVGALVDHFRAPMAPPLALLLPNGSRIHVQARFNWATWYSVGDPGHASSNAAAAEGLNAADAGAARPAGPRAAEPAAQPAPMADGLRSLDTGDAQMRSVIHKLRRIIDREIPILILGETGTGKELLARAIHRDSRRSRQAFVAVNCASIPETLIEAELFGYEEGAFTGARRRGAVGKIVQAHGGTLFLDEVGDMPLALQARLLRVLQERQVTPLGSGKAVPVDVAIVAATHRNLRAMIAAGAFREDLYYRLNGLLVKLPALRERSDLPRLAQAILGSECSAGHLRLADEVMRRFGLCSWPGNVRQLSNVLRTAAVMAAGEPSITCAHLPDDFLEDTGNAMPAFAEAAQQAVADSPAAAALPADPLPAPAAPAAELTLQEAELEMIRRAVDAEGGNISAASKRLGIARNTIYRKLHWNVRR